jgi:hypothetical protein
MMDLGGIGSAWRKQIGNAKSPGSLIETRSMVMEENLLVVSGKNSSLT